MRRTAAHLLGTLALVCLLVAPLTAPDAEARPRAVAEEKKKQLTAREAARRAQAQYGGRVLKVTRQGNNFRVRLLQDSGRVLTVTIRG